MVAASHTAGVAVVRLEVRLRVRLDGQQEAVIAVVRLEVRLELMVVRDAVIVPLTTKVNSTTVKAFWANARRIKPNWIL